MPKLSAFDAVSPAFGHMSKMLFNPFRLRTWLKIGFIGWLAGGVAAANFRSFNFGTPSPSNGEVPGDFGRKVSEAISNFHAHIGNYVWIIFCVVLLFVALSLVFVYLFSRFRFVLFDTVINKEAIISRGWHRYGDQAGRYFIFWIIFTFLSWIAIGVIVGLPLWHAYKAGLFHGDNALWSLFALIGSVLLGLLLFALVSTLVRTFAQDFLLPLMALDNLGIGAGFAAIRQMVAREPGAWAGYLLMKLVLAIAAGIALWVVLFITGLLLCLILAIPVVVVILVGIALIKAGSAGLVIAIVLFVIAGLACAACFFCLTLTVSAPVVVFFQSYSLYFLGGRYPKLDALLWPATPAPQT